MLLRSFSNQLDARRQHGQSLWWQMLKRTLECLLLIAITWLVVHIVGIALFNRWRRPYGWTENDLFALSLAFHNYAATNGGHFPYSAQGPEAALTALVRDDVEGMASILRGKSVSTNTVLRRIQAGGRLDAKTCGWHYVQGLRVTDPTTVAIVWDKIGLTNRGERIPGGGHEVLYINHRREIIRNDDWNAFLEHQKDLYEILRLKASVVPNEKDFRGVSSVVPTEK